MSSSCKNDIIQPIVNITMLLCDKGYSRKKDLGGEDGRRYIFLWVVVAESFQIIWTIGVRPNLISWVVGISLCGRGRKNIICQKKERIFIKSSQKKA